MNATSIMCLNLTQSILTARLLLPDPERERLDAATTVYISDSSLDDLNKARAVIYEFMNKTQNTQTQNTQSEAR